MQVRAEEGTPVVPLSQRPGAASWRHTPGVGGRAGHAPQPTLRSLENYRWLPSANPFPKGAPPLRAGGPVHAARQNQINKPLAQFEREKTNEIYF